MYITQARTQRVVFVDREAQRHVCTITFVGIVGQVCIIRFKVVIEDAATKAHTINGEVRVSDRQLSIGLVVVFGAVNPDRITGT